VQGFAAAQAVLGNMYRKGEGVEKDAVQALRWFRKAAEQGVAQAQYNLGVRYENGNGVEKDAVQALH
jgi:TPR repeat protein